MFTIYYDTLKRLAVEKDYLVPLRYFERDFLKVLGYALPSGPFPAKHYRFVRGDFVANDNTAFEGSGISGTTLEALNSNTLQSGTQEWEARMLMRDLIRYYLEDAPLNTRRILNELNKL